MIKFIKNFRKDEAGAVTVDWVVLTAAVVGLAVAAFTAIESTTSTLTTEAAVALNDFAKNYERVVTVEQLLNGERVEALAAFSLNEHCAMIEKIEAEEICKATFSDEHVSNLANYFITLPSEAAMKLWTVISTAGVQENVVKFHGANQGAVGSHLSKILGA